MITLAGRGAARRREILMLAVDHVEQICAIKDHGRQLPLDLKLVVVWVVAVVSMNKTFRELAAYYARSQYETLTHQQKVARLYRRALRSLTDWKPKRYQWNAVACEIRAEFDSNRAADPA